jgi:stage IV sporulation protein FB
MHDPAGTWAIPLGRLFGVRIRVHWLFPFVALGLILRVYFAKIPGTDRPAFPRDAWVDEAILAAILFVTVLLHEFGHCFGARWVGGEANDILMWPLGGLASVDVPHRPKAHFLTTAAGPFVNLLICVACALLLLVVWDKGALQPPWNPLPGGFPFRGNNPMPENEQLVQLRTWAGENVLLGPYALPVFIARTFWVSYFLFLLNVVLVGFPLDGGRLLQASLWPSFGYRQATLIAVFAGFAVVFIVGLYAIISDAVLAIILAWFIYVSCQRQYVLLELGGDEGPFGYDFSQGYTSLERDQVQAAPPRRKVSWWRRWLQRRRAARLQREQERREAEERRMDELLDKLHREGKNALTDEEQRFMKRVSDRYRKNQR